MPDWSRRRTLQAVAATATACLTGCNTNESTRDTPALERAITDYERRSVRSTATDWLFAHDDQRGPDIQSSFVVDTDERTQLRFADAPAADRLARFVTDTDFAERSVYLYQRTLDGCHRLRLVRVRRDEGIHVSFCRDRRPADVQCDTNAQVVAAIALRLPFPGDAVDGFGGGFGRCQREFGGSSQPATKGESA